MLIAIILKKCSVEMVQLGIGFIWMKTPEEQMRV